MPPRLVIMFSIVLTLLVGTHGYLGWRHIGSSGLTGGARLAAWAAVVLFGAVLLMGFTARFWLRPPFADIAVWIGMIALGLFSFVFVATVFRDVAWLLAKATSTLPADPQRRTMLLRMTNAAVFDHAADAVDLESHAVGVDRQQPDRASSALVGAPRSSTSTSTLSVCLPHWKASRSLRSPTCMSARRSKKPSSTRSSTP